MRTSRSSYSCSSVLETQPKVSFSRVSICLLRSSASSLRMSWGPWTEYDITDSLPSNEASLDAQSSKRCKDVDTDDALQILVELWKKQAISNICARWTLFSDHPT